MQQQQERYLTNMQDHQIHQRQPSYGQINNSSTAYGFTGRSSQPTQQANLYYNGQPAEGYNEFNNMADNQLDDIGNQLRLTTNQRVAAAMYPESISNTTSIPSTQINGQQTAVQRLAEPSQMLVHSIVNLINYQDDADLATKALPELIKLLNDEDQIVVSQAAMVVHQLSRKEASRHALCNSAPLIKALLQTLETSNDLETTKFTSEILSSLSQQHQGLLAIFKTGGIKALIYALSSPVDGVVFNALTTLHNLLLHQEGAKMTVRLNGGLQKMVNLLQRDNPKFLAIVADCLHILSYGNQEGKLIILASGGPAELVRILHSYNYEKLLYTTTRVIKVLSVCPSNKPVLIQAGGMQALAMCLDHPSKRLAQECLWALRNLSDSATKEINLEPLLQRLVQLLEGNDINMVTCAAGTLSNLTCNNLNNKMFACKTGCVQALLQTIRNSGDRDEIAEPAICALRHVTSRHPEAEIAQDAIRLHGGLPDICKLLDSSEWPLLTAVAGLLKNLANNLQNSIALRDLGVIQRLALLLGKAHQILQESPDDITNTAGIKMERVIESVVGALHSLAVDYQNRLLINDANLISTIISLLYNENENIVIVALDLLSELGKIPEVASNIEAHGGLQIATGLLASPREIIRQRAALILSTVSCDKMPEYTQRLSNEINTLFQSEHHGGGSQWIEAPSQDIPSVYNVEGQMQGASSLHSDSSRQNIYNTGSTVYATNHDIEVSGYGRSGHLIHQPENTQIQHTQKQDQTPGQNQPPSEPWFDTDL